MTQIDGSEFLRKSYAALERFAQEQQGQGDPFVEVPASAPSAAARDRLVNYVNSPEGKEAIARLSSPALAAKPVLFLNEEASQQVADAFRHASGPARPPVYTPPAAPVPATLPEVSHVATNQGVEYAYAVDVVTRSQLTAAAAARPAPTPVPLFAHLAPNQWAGQQATGPNPAWLWVNGAATKGGAVPPGPFKLPQTTPAGLGVGQNVAAGAAFGAVSGAGLAYMLNAARHFSSDPVSQALFAVAGAAAGFGLGGLIGAKLVKPEDVTTPLLKMATGKA